MMTFMIHLKILTLLSYKLDKEQYNKFKIQQKVSTKIFDFLHNNWNIYGLLLVYVFISYSILKVLSVLSLLTLFVLTAFICLLFYLLGCKNSALFYIRNMDTMFSIMELEKEQKLKSKDKNSMIDKIRKKVEKEYKDVDIDEYN